MALCQVQAPGAITEVTRRRLTARLGDRKKVIVGTGCHDLGIPRGHGVGRTEVHEESPESPREVEARANAVLLDIKAKLDSSITRTIDFFRNLDVNGDGHASPGELRTALRALGYLPGEDDFASLLDRLDTDHTGDISVKELDRGLKRVGRMTKQVASTTMRRPPAPSSARIAAAGAALSDDASLGSMLEELSLQKIELQERQDWEVERGIRKERRQEALARSRFVPEVAPWAATSVYPRVFNDVGRHPGRYLEPLEASRASRPAQCYEPQPEVPFRHAAGSVPRMFGQTRLPPRRVDKAPLFFGDSPRGEGPEFPMSPRPFGAVDCTSPRVPRDASLLPGASLTKAQV